MLKKILSKFLPYTLFLFVSVGLGEEYPIQIENAPINTHDVKSIQRGARAYATYCMICHSINYMGRDPIARASGITLAKMPELSKKWWFGSAPPDLSLIAKVRTANWLYTYLHVFYKDPARPTGSNNLLLDNVNMPDPFIGLRGEQILIVKKSDLFSDSPLLVRKLPYYSVLRLNHAGSMPADEFDRVVADIVNFLVYASDPKKYARERLGMWVLPFIAILFVLLYLLKREYWKSIKRQADKPRDDG